MVGYRWQLAEDETGAFKKRLQEVFDLVAQGYDRDVLRLYPFAADRMVFALRIAPGEKVLDVATGTGAAAIAAARLVGAKGRVTGIDLAEGMLDRAYDNAQRQGLNNVDLHTMDAEQLEFRDGYFDVVICAAALYLVPDMLRCLKEVARVLKPGGRFVFSGCTRQFLQPMVHLLVDSLTELGIERRAPMPAPYWQRLGTDDDYSSLLEAAGFTRVQVHTRQLGYHLSSASDWWEVAWNCELRELVEYLPKDAVGQFRVAHQEAVERLRTEKGIWLDAGTVFAAGVKPPKRNAGTPSRRAGRCHPVSGSGFRAMPRCVR